MAVCSKEGPSDVFDLTVGFSAGGWFHIYHFGACQAIVDSGIIDKFAAEGKRIRFSGSSAGALAATCMASKNYRFDEICESVMKYVEHYRASWFNLFCMKKYLDESVEEFAVDMRDLELKPELSESINDGSLEIFVTTLPNMKRKIIKQFHSYEDIVESLNASCCMAPLVGVPFRLRETGEWVCDGALAAVTPHVGEPKTITVSAFYFSRATVHPTIFVPVWWGLFPPEKVAFRNLFLLGYNDMIEGLVANGHLTPEAGESLLKPEVKFLKERNIFHRLFLYLLDFLTVLFVRPFVISCIYAELAFMSFVYFVKGLLTFDNSSLKRMYNNMRNILSLRTFGRLLFGGKVPHNEERLEGSSRVFRVFHPIVLGGNKTTERAVVSLSGVPTGHTPSLSAKTRKRAKLAAREKLR